MFKKSALLVLALGLVLSASLSAQESQQFTITAPNGKVEQLPEGVKLNIPNVADLTQAEIDALLAKNQCGDNPAAPTFCVGWTGRFCTGSGLLIPCNSGANGTWRSIQFGCTRSYLATGPNLTGTVSVFSGFPQDTCITNNNPAAVYASFACTTP